MIPNLLDVIKSKHFKEIPAKIQSTQDFIDIVVPKGFETVVQASHDNFEVYIKSVEEENSYEISISSVLFNTDYAFPKFIITNLDSNLCSLNQNQLFHLMLIYRFNQFKPMKRPYLNLISKDISSIMRYIQYVTPTSYNARKKNDNLAVFIHYKDLGELSSTFSELFASNSVNEAMWNTILNKNNVIVSSIGTMSRSNSVVLKEGNSQVFRSPGYKELPDSFISMFPTGQNIPARQQTHLLGNSFALLNPSKSNIQQDNLVINGELINKDKCLREAIVVYNPIEESNRFLSGEIEIDNNIARELLNTNNIVEDCFSELLVEEGVTYYPEFQDFEIGTTLLDEKVILKNYKDFTIKSIEITGINSSKKLRISGHVYAGNCRIISNTGLKGVTKVVNNLGEIRLHHVRKEDEPSDDFETGFKDSVQETLVNSELQERYPNLDLESLNAYPPVEVSDPVVYDILKPDLVCGMNSVKAKSNTIVLSRACLAVKLGYYVPSVKFGFEGLLNSLDAKEINEASESLPAFTYVGPDGIVREVEIGLIYLSYTEICGIYTKIKPQSFSFESGRALATNGESSKALYKHIWENYLEEDKVEAVQELYKILVLAQTEVFNNEDDLPIYNLNEVNELFSQNDLVLQSRNQFPSDSKLLDEEFNQGFFIDLSKYENAPIIRIPSAKTLRLFSGVLNNGDITYHVNLINVSKIIRGCLKIDNSFALNTIYSKDKSRTTSALSYNAYLNTVRSTVYSGEESSQQMVQSLIKPKVPGCSLKQVSEHLLPDNVVVITDDSMYKKLKKVSLRGSPENSLEEHELKILMLMSQYEFNTVEEKKLLFKELRKDAPLALGIRSPSLWLTQNLKLEIWDRHTYDLYLNIYHNTTIDKSLNPKFNRDILLVPTNVLMYSHGDCDGDLFPMFILNYEGQKLLRDFKLENILEEELAWHDMYKAKEFSSTLSLEEVEHEYKLYDLPYEQYSSFIVNAVVAKNNIGVSTLDIWAFSMLLEVYKQYCIDNNNVYKKKDRATPLTQISDHDIQLLGYTYTRLVQEMVVEGIKHTSNGSKDFDIYFLKSIGKTENEKKIRNDLTGMFGLSNMLVDKLLFIIRFAEDNHDLAKACRNFISLYNKGRFPADPEALDYWEKYISETTYFGSLLKPLFDIKNANQEAYEEGEDSLDSLFN